MNKYNFLRPFFFLELLLVMFKYMSLQMLLNKCRANVSMAFLILQKASSHNLEEYMSRVVSDLKVSHGDVVNVGR